MPHFISTRSREASRLDSRPETAGVYRKLAAALRWRCFGGAGDVRHRGSHRIDVAKLDVV